MLFSLPYQTARMQTVNDLILCEITFENALRSSIICVLFAIDLPEFVRISCSASTIPRALHASLRRNSSTAICLFSGLFAYSTFKVNNCVLHRFKYVISVRPRYAHVRFAGWEEA